MAQQKKIIIVGIGELGEDFIDYVIRNNDEDVDFALIGNPDIYDEKKSFYNAHLKFILNSNGECEMLIADNFSASDIIMFIVVEDVDCPLASIIARAAKTSGILTVEILAVFPYSEYLDYWLHELKQSCDTLFFLVKPDFLENAQKRIKSFTNLFTKSGYVNLDFEDIKAVLTDGGSAFFGEGYFGGNNKSKNAAIQAASAMRFTPKRVLVNITTGEDISLVELSEALKLIEDRASPDAYVIWGHVIDESLGDNVRVSCIAMD